MYLTKPFDIERLVCLVHAAVNLFPGRVEEAVLGVSPVMRRVEEIIQKVADFAVTASKLFTAFRRLASTG